jgi:hypothetical protein
MVKTIFPASQRSLFTEGQPVILEIIVPGANPQDKRSQLAKLSRLPLLRPFHTFCVKPKHQTRRRYLC